MNAQVFYDLPSFTSKLLMMSNVNEFTKNLPWFTKKMWKIQKRKLFKITAGTFGFDLSPQPKRPQVQYLFQPDLWIDNLYRSQIGWYGARIEGGFRSQEFHKAIKPWVWETWGERNARQVQKSEMDFVLKIFPLAIHISWGKTHIAYISPLLITYPLRSGELTMVYKRVNYGRSHILVKIKAIKPTMKERRGKGKYDEKNKNEVFPWRSHLPFKEFMCQICPNNTFCF